MRRRVLLPWVWAQSVDALIENGRGAAERLERHGARHIREPRHSLRPQQGESPDGCHGLAELCSR